MCGAVEDMGIKAKLRSAYMSEWPHRQGGCLAC